MSSLMQGQGGTIDSFPEIVNIDEGISPNDTSIGQSDSLHNMLNPAETRLSNYTVLSAGAMHGNATTLDVQSISGWNSGERTSRLGQQNQVMQDALNHRLNGDDVSKTERGSSSSYDARIWTAPRSEERWIGPPDVFLTGRLDNGRSGNLGRSGSICLQRSGSNHIPHNVNLNEGFISGSGTGASDVGTVASPNFNNSGGLEREQISNASVSYDNVGSSSGSTNHAEVENNNDSSSSLGSWGLSCKRKSLEGTSGQSAGASSCFQHIENAAWRSGNDCNEASSSLSLSTPSSNFLNLTPPDQSNPRIGLGMRAVVSDAFPSGERRANPGNQQESSPFSLSSTRAAGYSSFFSPSHPRFAPFNDTLGLRSTAAIAGSSGSASTQPHTRTTSIVPRNVHPIPWTVTSNSGVGNPSSSINSGERAVVLREEPNIRNIPRNTAEHPVFVPASEMRNVSQDSTGWSLSSGNHSTSGGIPSSNRPRSSSSIHSMSTPARNAPHNPSVCNQQRLSEFSPWSLFPPIDSDSGGNSGHSSLPSPSPSTSAQETVAPSQSNNQGNNQPYPRLALIMERHGDDVLGMSNSLRALASDIEGRHRLISEIRQVLNAVRRGENLRIEDHTQFDPFIYHGMTEMHDRHRDMRLDVDNMSYEELLALEERIGDVSTGLSEETILKRMKQQKHSSTSMESPQDLEPCCVCQEAYVDGDDIGILDCGHDFHTNCIKQWLLLKNMCPICKTTGLLK